MSTPLNSPKKSAVSVQTSYDKAVAAHKLALEKQQLNSKNSTLIKANDSINAQLTSPMSIPAKDLFPGVYPANLDAQVAAYQDVVVWEQNIVTASSWGANGANASLTNARNKNIQSRVGTSAYSGTLSSGDLALLNADITYLSGQVSKIQTKINTLKASLSKNNALITGNTKTLSSTSSVSGSTKVTNTTQTAKPTPPPEFPTSDYLWNLPPHKWSLPVDPYTIAPDTTIKRTDSFHATRRGRIWYYNGYVGPTNIPDYANTGTPSGQNPVTVNKYGFQFIWNPETFSQSTAVNMNVTPSGSDPSIALTGFAAANSTMSFTLRLDRTNDFTAMRGGDATTKAIIQKNADNKVANQAITTVNSALGTTAFKLRPVVPVFDPAWLDYYKDGQPVGTTPTTLEQKITDLLTYGTEADLEYLYRTVNGSGWKGIGGRETSNIGYLMPALIRLDLGQQKFVGVVSSVQVNHLAFTRDMVPIRTDVNISVDLRANIQPQTNNGAVGR